MNDLWTSRNRLLLLLALIPLGLLIYSRAMGAPFVYDDRGYILQNEAIRSLAYFSDLSGSRYIGFLSFALNYRFGGLEPFGYHLVNIIIHIINSALVFSLVTAAFATPRVRDFLRSGPATPNATAIAFVAAVIFLAHPLNTQAVSYVTQRFASLATMFYLLSLVLFAASRSRFYSENGGTYRRGGGGAMKWALYAGSLLSVVLAMKTKEISFTIPFVVVLYDAVFFPARHGDAAAKRLRIPYYASLLIIPVTLLLPDLTGLGGSGIGDAIRSAQLREAVELSRHDYVLTQFRVVTTYIRLFFVPVGQSVDYQYPISRSILEPQTLASTAFLAVLFFGAVFSGLRSLACRSITGVLFAFGVVWFFMTLSVESFMVPIQDVIFEHRAYLPGIGLSIAAASAVFHAIERLRQRRLVNVTDGVVAAVLFFLLVPPMAYGVDGRNKLWCDELALIDEAVERYPGKHRLYYARALAHFDRGEHAEALEESNRAIEVNPASADAYNMRGIARSALGRYEESIDDFTTAVKLDPGFERAYFNRALSYARTGKADRSVEDLTTVVAIDPGSADAYNERGVVLARTGRLAEALRDMERSCGLGSSRGCENLEMLAATLARPGPAGGGQRP